MNVWFRLLILMLWLPGCGSRENNSSEDGSTNMWAKGFRIEKVGKEKQPTRLTVFNPWEKAAGISYDYYLINKETIVPDSLENKRVIKTPVERVICLSTTHLAFLDVLDETEAVVGISGSHYISNPEIRNRMQQEKVPDVGYGQQLNYELIVHLKPELVMVYGVGSEVTSYTRKLEELGIPVVMIGEYLEESPLGKAEWIKFVGALFEKEVVAEEYFSHVEDEYRRLKKYIAGVSEKPVVLVGSPYKDAWWIPGGKSYLANLIKDAGGDYLGSNNSSHESYVISFENALAWGGKADVWMNMSNLATKEEILTADDRFKKLGVFNRGKIYNNIKRLSESGGNDFWESGTVNPHLVLRDMIMIFHPGLIEEELVYYKEIR